MKTTRRKVNCSCCERELWLWKRGKEHWVDNVPMMIEEHYVWFPCDNQRPPWVEEARAEAHLQKDKSRFEGAMNQKFYVFCPWCYEQFHRGMASGRVFFNPPLP